MIRVASLSAGVHAPASRFRIRQHIAALAQHGIQVRDYPQPFSNDRWQRMLPHGLRIRHVPLLWPIVPLVELLQVAAVIRKVVASWRYDVTWLSRGLYPGFPTLERGLKGPLVLDVDDAIWLDRPCGLVHARNAARRACAIAVCNQYLAEWFSSYNKDVRIIPTAVDTERYFPLERPQGTPFTVGWMGTSSNFQYLYSINDALAAFFRHAKDARMLVVAELLPRELAVPADKLDYVKWTPDNEAGLLQQMDVGLMPLSDSAWARGKCSFKMLQYMACGIPVLVSPVGLNVDVLSKAEVGYGPVDVQEWLNGLVNLYEHPSRAQALGRNGRGVVERHFSREVVTGSLACLFREVA